MDTHVIDSSQHNRPIAVGFKTDKGRKRAGNEDSLAVLSRKELNSWLDGLFVVADGMGGASGGEIASGIVINSLPEAVQSSLADQPGSDLPHELAALLHRSIQQANRDVWDYKQQHEGLRNMGTTCVAAMIAHVRGKDAPPNGALVLANVGDSRAYLLRGGKLSQITEDHSVVWEQVKAGKMTPEEAANSRFRNEITRAMGLRENVAPDITIRELRDGDVVMLCSDGLTTEVDDLAIARLLASSSDPQIACDRLVEAALNNGGSDNVTVVVLHYGAFVPLASAVMSREPLEHDEYEDITDPNQVWKRSLAPSRASQREDWEGEGRDRYASGSRGGYGEDVAVPRRGVSVGLFGLLLLVALAEAVGLYLFWIGRLQPRAPVVSPVALASRPTDKPLTYRTPVVIYGQAPLWEGTLQMLPEERLLVVTMQGQELAVTSGGTATPLGTTSAKPFPLSQPTLRGDGSEKPARPLPAVTLDASGNRYELNGATHAIDKYDSAGIMVAHNIGQGELQAPSNLAVDKVGNLYVIDKGALKKLVAVPDTGKTQPTSAPDASTGTENAAPRRKKPAAPSSPTVEPTSE